jgi:hypothetical protein
MAWDVRTDRLTLVLFVIIFGSVLAFSATARASGVTVTVNMLGESPLFDGSTPVLVAGIWNQIAVNLTSLLNGGTLTAKAYLPGASPAGPANTYEWVRDEGNNSWSDPLYGTFVQANLSLDTGSRVVFVAGVDAQATPGFWTVDVLQGNSSVYQGTVEVQAPSLAYGVSAADVAFRVDPFTSASLTSQAAGQYLRITNQGNVPLGLRLGFDVLRSALSLTNPATVAHVGGAATFYVALAVGPLPPEIVDVNGTTQVFVAGAIPSSGSSVLVPTLQASFHVAVTVGRAGYDLQVIGNVALQTLDTVHVSFGAITSWTIYLTGGQNVSLNVTADGVGLLGVTAGGSALTLPATLPLASSRELALTVQAQATRAASGSVSFILRLLGTGDVRTFTTNIIVSGGPPGPSGIASSWVWIAGAIAVGSVFALVAYTQLRVRRRRASVEETNAPRKRGYHARKRRLEDRRREDSEKRGKTTEHEIPRRGNGSKALAAKRSR